MRWRNVSILTIICFDSLWVSFMTDVLWLSRLLLSREFDFGRGVTL
jgi:hypothetical protein